MIPVINDEFLSPVTVVEYPSRDFYLDKDGNIVNGIVNDLEAVKQAVYLILNTERYDYLIYPWEYGAELSDLMGQPFSYVIPEVERRVSEALTQDERISGVSNFSFEKKKNNLHATFTVNTIFGNIESEVIVSV